MATINSAALALITVDDTVTVSVPFNAGFTAFERQLAGLGMKFHRHLDVVGIDPAGSLTGNVITSFPLVDFPVTVGAGTQTIPMWILTAIQRPTELPVVNVVALILILLSVVPVYIATRLSASVAETRI